MARLPGAFLLYRSNRRDRYLTESALPSGTLCASLKMIENPLN